MKQLEAGDWLFITSCRHTRAAAGAACCCHGGPSVWFWIFKGSQWMGQGNQGYAIRCWRNANINKYKCYSVYNLMAEMLEWSIAVPQSQICLDVWLNLFANGCCCSSAEKMEVMSPNRSTVDTNMTSWQFILLWKTAFLIKLFFFP